MNRRATFATSLGLAATLLAVPSVALANTGTKTIVRVSGDSANPGTVTGKITINNVTTGGHYLVVDALQARPDPDNQPDRFYQGSYAFHFSNCVGGSTPADTTETIGSGGGFQPGLPPTNSGAPQWNPTSGSMSCDYSLTFTGSAPAGTLTGFTNDAWLLQNGKVMASFNATFTPPPVVPEAPMAVLLPLTGLAMLGATVFVLRRRQGGLSQDSIS
jgi:hypothetical protein